MSAAEERLANDPTSELWGEHRSRYRFAAQFAAGQRVLDVATGAGFGLPIVAHAGGRPIGVDYDALALGDVRQRQPAAALVRADATRLPLLSDCCDLVVSFETIEHVPDAQALVVEIRRVLRPGGRLVLSTPNRAFGAAGRHTNNPFHVREFTADELRVLLRESFEEVQLYGQRPAPTFRYVPYLMTQPHREPAAVAWKLQTRLPYGVKNGLALALSGRPFYPSERDYCFEPDGYENSHALVAVAR
jgi:SAM-dependent methyltransferase